MIAQGSSPRLTRLNTYLRRIDLLAKLLAPLYVSLLTTAASFVFSAAFLLGFALVSMVFEFSCELDRKFGVFKLGRFLGSGQALINSASIDSINRDRRRLPTLAHPGNRRGS